MASSATARRHVPGNGNPAVRRALCLSCYKMRREPVITVQSEDGHGGALKEHALDHAGHCAQALAGCWNRASRRGSEWPRR